MIPVAISDAPAADFIPQGNIALTAGIRHFIVENVRTARRFLRRCDPTFPIDDCTFVELNGHTDPKDIASFLAPLRSGNPMGMMSEAGCPGVADPGASVAAIAQREGLDVVPLAGPSSILMALMASGFNGQGFSFVGYIPVKEADKAKRIRELESIALRTGMTQIFIETPYRNNSTLRLLAETLHPDTLLCVASGITSAAESIVTLPAARWRTRNCDFAKIPTIFLIGCNDASAPARPSGKSGSKR